MVCDHCGRSNLPGSEFCANPACGAYLGWDATRTVTAGGPRGPGPGRPADRKPAERAERPDQEGYGVRLRLGEPPAAELLAGSEHRVQVTVTNTGTLVDEFVLVVEAPVRWVGVEPVRVSVYPGREATATVVLAPPAAPAPPAGPLGYRLVVRSALHPQVAAAAGGGAVVAAVDAVAAELAPVTATGRRGATARVLVRNDGNRPALVALDRADHEPGVSAQVAPVALELGPGRAAEGTVRLASRRRWFGQPVRHPYRVRVTPRAGEPRVLDGAFVQRPLLPGWVPRAALGLVPLLVLGGVLLARNDPAPQTPVAGATPTPTPGPTSTAPSPTPSPTPTTTPPTTTTAAPTEITVPRVVEQDVRDATEALQKAGLTIRPRRVRNNAVAEDRVVSTDPEPGELTTSGSTVLVVVSDGPTPRWDLVPAAADATWRTTSGTLVFGEEDAAAAGVARRVAEPADGSTAPAALETRPQVEDGVVTGDFPLPGPIIEGDHFAAGLAFRGGLPPGEVTFSVVAVRPGRAVVPLASKTLSSTDPPFVLEVDLAATAGAEGATVLRISVAADGSADGDGALWVEPHLEGRP